MKKLLFLLAILLATSVFAQEPAEVERVAPKYDLTRPNPKTTAQMNSMTRMVEGSEVWNTDTNTIWRYVSATWTDTGSAGGGTTYTAGTGLDLSPGNEFSVNNSEIAAPWAGITGVPADIADGDDDTQYTASNGIQLIGSVFSVDVLNAVFSTFAKRNEANTYSGGAQNFQNIDIQLPGNILESNANTVITSGGDPTGQTSILFNVDGTLRALTASPTDIQYNGQSLLGSASAGGDMLKADYDADDDRAIDDVDTNTVGSDEIINASIQAIDIGAGQVGTSEIADGAITGTDISNNTIQEVDLEITNSAIENYVLSINGSNQFFWKIDEGGGDAWGDPVDADILPSSPGTRSLGNLANPFGSIRANTIEGVSRLGTSDLLFIEGQSSPSFSANGQIGHNSVTDRLVVRLNGIEQEIAHVSDISTGSITDGERARIANENHFFWVPSNASPRTVGGGAIVERSSPTADEGLKTVNYPGPGSLGVVEYQFDGTTTTGESVIITTKTSSQIATIVPENENVTFIFKGQTGNNNSVRLNQAGSMVTVMKTDVANEYFISPGYDEQFETSFAGPDAISNAAPIHYWTPASVVASGSTDGSTVTGWDDTVGSLNGTNSGSVTVNVDGADTEVEFDGGYLDFPDVASVDFDNQTDSYSIVFKTGSTGGTTGYFISKLAPGSEQYGVFDGSSTTLQTNIGGSNSGGLSFTHQGNDVFILVVSGSTYDFYANNTQLVTGGAVGTAQYTGSLNFGSRTDGGFLSDHSLERVAIYDKALSGAEITAIQTQYVEN